MAGGSSCMRSLLACMILCAVITRPGGICYEGTHDQLLGVHSSLPYARSQITIEVC
jgi:hypothetical protein